MLTQESLNKFCLENNITSFTNWIKETYESDELLDIYENGCSGGVSGMIYYTETGALYDRFHDNIWSLLNEYADDLGEESAISLLQAKEIGDHYHFANYFVWIAAELIAAKLYDSSTTN